MAVHEFAHAPRRLDTELCLITAPRCEDLPGRIQALQRNLRAHPDVLLRDVACTIGRDFEGKAACLSIVAESTGDLVAKLDRALAKLVDPACERIQDKSGIFYFREPLGAGGKIAWLFPGEGAQYPRMLQDLCLLFPDVRAMFDLVDLACGQESAGFVPSAHVFPPPGVTEGSDRDDLFVWDAAVMAVVGANMAMLKLCQALEIPVHATVGHSFGDFAALELGQMLCADEAQRVSLLRLALRQIREISGFKDIPPAVLVNVGGAEMAFIESLIEGHSETLCIAMANCPHQCILCATGPARDELAQTVITKLSAEGAICTLLPFDRPYHTHHFGPAMVVQRQFYTQTGVHPPILDVYSCCTADKFPQDVEGILDVATRHWSSPVRFQETIERMYADGVRIFLETGPRGNLSAFVDDILRDRPHAAIPMDREHRSAVSHLHGALGLLAAHGVRLNVAPLHQHRQSRFLGGEEWNLPVDDSMRRTIHMGLQCPTMDASQYVREVGPLRRASTAPVAPGTDAVAIPGASAGAAVARPASPRDQVMMAYLDTMNQFLAAQEQILTGGGMMPAAAPTMPPASITAAPLRLMIDEIVSIQPGQSIEVVKTLQLNEHRFLMDHTLGNGISAFDPDLRGLPIMPILFTAELMVEAALALCGDNLVVIAHENIRANRGIFFEREHLTLRARGVRIPSADASLRVRVEVRVDRPDNVELSRRGPCQVEATMVLAPAYPPVPSAPPLALENDEPCGWMGREIYPARAFQGPCFQAIQAIDRIGSNGLTGRLVVQPSNTIFRSHPAPGLTFDPLLIDATGQSQWVWANKDPDAGHFYLPFSVELLRLCMPPLPPGTPLRLESMIHEESAGQILGSARAVDETGQLCVEIVNLRQRVFEIPTVLKRMLREPLRHAFSAAWSPPTPVQACLRGTWAFTRIADIPESLLTSSFGLWRRAWAFLVLNPPERELWLALEDEPHRQIEWLLGRTAAKDAVRELLRRPDAPLLGAADIAIGEEAGGRPVVTGGWRHDLPQRPAISIAHTKGIVLAAACDAASGVLPGIDIERIRTPSPDMVDGTLSAAERARLPQGDGEPDEWFFRVWTAKEAVGKALGTGVLPDPKTIILEHVDTASGTLQFRVAGRATLETAFTFRDQTHAVAICQRPDFSDK